MTTVTRTTVDKHATAEAFVREFRQRNPDAWPTIKVVMAQAKVGKGTAERARRTVKADMPIMAQ